MAPRDYFTLLEFREVTGDRTSPFRYQDDDIGRAQEQVIDYLERWAYTAWPNVVAQGIGDMTAGSADLTASVDLFQPGMVGTAVRVAGAGTGGADLSTTVTTYTDPQTITLAAAAATNVTGGELFWDGDGTAASPRSRTDLFYSVNWPQLTTDYVPLLSVSEVMAPNDYAVTTYTTDDEIGLLAWGTKLIEPSYDLVTVDYTYGFTSCPWAVKRACIDACKTLMTTEENRSGLPPGVTQYSTGNTTVFLQQTQEPAEPWPWDRTASDAIAVYWKRPRRFITV